MSNIIYLAEKNLPQDCYVFKHSTRCGVSAHASNKIKSTEFDLPLYWVNVIEQRDLSNWIAQQYGEVHQSPQLIKIKSGKVEKVWNHSEISLGELR